MSTQCNRFVQNAWKKELCSNCFKPREEHSGTEDPLKLNIGRAASTNLKTDNLKLQSILRLTASCQKDRKKKSVAFPDSLTEIIGYGGDDFFSDGEDDEDSGLAESLNSEDEVMVPDSEEERALGNLTRANTNFNTVTANLTESVANTADIPKSSTTPPTAPKPFASLMLGRIQKDADGRKTTLLVSVTPFGGDESVPTAKRPSDRKVVVNGFSNQSKVKDPVSTVDNKLEISKIAKKSELETKKDEKTEQQYHSSSGLEKIVDMPLITSTNLISVIQRNELSDTEKSSVDKSLDSVQSTVGELGKAERKIAVVSRTPAIKKTEIEKPKVVTPSLKNGSRAEYEIITRIVKRSADISSPESDSTELESKGIELTLTPFSKNEADEATESDRSMMVRGKDVNKITVMAADSVASKEVSLVTGVPKVVGEVTPACVPNEKKFSFEESRESAGEPDGKADEEEMTEPPALPKSPPPIDPRPLLHNETNKLSNAIREPRPSFLHGSINGESKPKPVVPQKPMSFGTKGNPSKVSCLVDDGTNVVKKIAPSGYVPPPPSVHNVTGRSTSGATSGIANDQEHWTSYKSTKNSKPCENQDAAPSTDQARSAQSEAKTDRQVDQSSGSHDQSIHRHPLEMGISRRNPSDAMANLSPAKDAPSNYKAKPPPLNLVRAQAPTDYREMDETLNGADEDADVPASSSAAELIRSPNKRRMAPRPPCGDVPPSTTEDLIPVSSLFARNPGASLKSDSPVVREKEKRERASSCSPKFRKAVCEVPDPTGSGTVATPLSESSPRRTISLSQDSLNNNGQEVREEKKRGRSRFSLKRFLRMGSKKDVDMTCGHSGGARTDEIPSTPQPKPRLEIIHPLELDGAAVEVLGNDRVGKVGEDQTDFCSIRSNDQGGRTATRSPSTSSSLHIAVRPGKPPPPPRNQSLEDWSRLDPPSKPSRPPPPRIETTSTTTSGPKQLPPRNEKSSSSSKSTASWQPSSAGGATSTSTSDSIYANLGEVRSALAPSKPQRTASMRDQTTSQPILKKQHVGSSSNLIAQSRDYEALVNLAHPTSDSPTSNDSHVYECLSSSPECDSNLELRHGHGSHLTCKRKSDSSAMEPGVEFKFHHQPFVRSTSLPYCGSETESELYAPYSFYTGDEGAEEDQDWKNKDDEFRLSRLRQRRGRSIVHRSLEDNYGAVVVANHEALAQFLEQQLNQVSQVPLSLRSLKNSNPRLSNFSVDSGSAIPIGKRIFYSATWNEHGVTLCIDFDLTMHVSRKEFYLAPIIEFIDSVPREMVERFSFPGSKDPEATISVLPRLQVCTMRSFGTTTKDAREEAATREASFVLLQLVNALKSLQARGIEEAPRNLSNVALCREDKDSCYRLYLLQALNIETNDEREEERVSLCQCALVALQELCLTKELPLVQELLMREKAVTLSQVKSVLEFSLWGPADLTLGGTREREVTLQRWLDLERANLLHALVRTRTLLTVSDDYQLLFLVRTSAKIMCEASILLDEQRARLAICAS